MALKTRTINIIIKAIITINGKNKIPQDKFLCPVLHNTFKNNVNIIITRIDQIEALPCPANNIKDMTENTKYIKAGVHNFVKNIYNI